MVRTRLPPQDHLQTKGRILIELPGDDTAHSQIPNYPIPNYFMGSGGLPASGNPEVVDLVFVDL